MVTNVKRPIVESHQIYGALSSEADERVLPEWLNAARGTASCKRVIQIIELIRRIDKSTSEALARGAFHHVFKPGKPRRYPKEKMKMQRAADLSLARLSRTLKRYTFRVAATKIILGGWAARVYCS